MRWNFVTRVYISINQGVLVDLAGYRYGEFKKRSATTGLQLFRSAVNFPMHDPGLSSVVLAMQGGKAFIRTQKPKLSVSNRKSKSLHGKVFPEGQAIG